MLTYIQCYVRQDLAVSIKLILKPFPDQFDLTSYIIVDDDDDNIEDGSARVAKSSHTTVRSFLPSFTSLIKCVMARVCSAQPEKPKTPPS